MQYIFGCSRTSQVRTPTRTVNIYGVNEAATTHVSEVPVQNLDISVNDLQHHKLVVALADPADEE